MSPTLEQPTLTSQAVEDLRRRILALSVEDRDLLLASLPDIADEEDSMRLHEEWKIEIERRVEELRSGKVQGIPAEDVFREIDALVDSP